MSSQRKIIGLNLACLVVLGATCLGAYQLMRGPLGVTRWIRLMGTGNSRERFEAVAALRHLGPKSRTAVPALLEILSNPENGLAAEAASALPQIDAERAYVFANELRESIERAHVAPGAGVVRVLDNLGPVAWRATPILRPLLQDADRERAGRAAWALLRSGYFGADVMESILERTADARFHVKWEALMQMEYLGLRGRTHRPTIERLASDPNATINYRAKLILASLEKTTSYRLGGLRGFPRMDGSYQQYSLIELAKLGPEATPLADEIATSLRHQSALIRFLATRALAALGPQARKSLAELRQLQHDPTTLVRDSAAATIESLEASR